MATTGVYGFLDNRNLIALFERLYEGSLNAGWAKRIGMPMPSDRETENYGWLGAAPSLDELMAEAKTEEGFNKFTYNLTNKEYAKQIPITEKDRRRDRLGQIQIRLGEFAAKAAEHWDVLSTLLIRAGAATTYGNGYDGTTFFATNHAESGTSQVNNLSSSHISALDVATATNPTADEMAAIIPEALGKFFLFTDDKGDPINGNARNFLILCGTAPIWKAALHALKATNLTSGASNPTVSVTSNGYNFDVVLSPRFSADTTVFYIFRTDSIVKPLILQEEVPLDPQMTDENSDMFKLRRRFMFSIYTSRAVGYARWQSALKLTLS